jgi:hypothetical protein
LKFNGNSLKIPGTLEFGETWPTCSLLHLVARKNKFPPKRAQEFEFLSRREFGLI